MYINGGDLPLSWATAPSMRLPPISATTVLPTLQTLRRARRLGPSGMDAARRHGGLKVLPTGWHSSDGVNWHGGGPECPKARRLRCHGRVRRRPTLRSETARAPTRPVKVAARPTITCIFRKRRGAAWAWARKLGPHQINGGYTVLDARCNGVDMATARWSHGRRALILRPHVEAVGDGGRLTI